MSLTSDYSLSDIAAVTGSTGGRNGGDMWGQEWIWIIVLFLFAGGWGNGFGGNGNNGAGGSGFQGYATRADINEGFALNNLDGGIRSLQNSICALDNSISGGFAGVDRGFNSTNVAMMQGFNGVDRSLCGVQSQVADCCCQTQNAIQGVRYDTATQAGDTRNMVQTSTRDIIDNANSNSRAILDFLTQDKISTLTAENQSLKFQASQTAQNSFIDTVGNYIIARLQTPSPVPAYQVPNPNAAYCGTCC